MYTYETKEKFEAIILDASFLFGELKNNFFAELKQYLKDDAFFYTCPSFYIEAEEVAHAVYPQLRKAVFNNMQNLKKQCGNQLKNYTKDNLEGGDVCCEALIYGFMKKKKTAIVTRNKLMIEVIVTKKLPITIIELNEVIKSRNQFRIITPDSFFEYESQSDVLTGDIFKTEKSVGYEPFKKGEKLVDSSNKEVILIKVLDRGKEGKIYSCKKEGMVAKIFKKNMLTQSKINNIYNFISFNSNKENQQKFPWLISPLEPLYVERNGQRYLVGYLMKKVENAIKLLDVGIFQNDLLYLNEVEYQNIKPIHVVNVCIAILRQIIYLHMNGILFGDFNSGNMAFEEKKWLDQFQSNDYIIFFDTDGYGYKDHSVVTAAPDLENPNNTTYDLKNKRDAIYREYDYVYLRIFSYLMIGAKAFGSHGLYEEHEGEKVDYRKMKMLPKELSQEFDLAFKKNSMRTPVELLYALKTSYAKFERQETYKRQFNDILNPLDTPIQQDDKREQKLPEDHKAETMQSQTGAKTMQSQTGTKTMQSQTGTEIKPKRHKFLIAAMILILIVITIFAYCYINKDESNISYIKSYEICSYDGYEDDDIYSICVNEELDIKNVQDI